MRAKEPRVQCDGSAVPVPGACSGVFAIDLETTGLSPRVDKVVEVAVIQLDRGVLMLVVTVLLVRSATDEHS